MNSIYELLNKKYDKRLLDIKEFKKSFQECQALLNEYNIPCQAKQDTDIFTLEIIANSIRVKRKFEDVYFDVYVTMFDYWYDLTYIERKKQMNLDIDRFKETLSYFEDKDHNKIYMPCFNSFLNNLYADEIVLLDLKQYHFFIRNFQDHITHDLYGVQPFLMGFSSAKVLAYANDGFVLYHEDSHRMYRYQNGSCVETLSFDRTTTKDLEIYRSLAAAFLLNHEDSMIALLLEHDMVSNHVKKQLQKYQKKKLKKERKD